MTGTTVIGSLLYEGSTLMATFTTHSGAFAAMVRLRCPDWQSLFSEQPADLAIEAAMRSRLAERSGIPFPQKPDAAADGH